MNFEDRYRILNHIEKIDQANIHELAEICNVTLPTIRKYLKILHEGKMIFFSRGIAKKIPKHNESLLGWRLDENKQAKEIIGQKVSDIIQDGETIFLGAGSTVYYCLNYLLSKKDLTVVTNSLHVLNFLTKYHQISVHCTGGFWNSKSNSFINFTKHYDSFSPDRSFIGALAVDLDRGITQNQEISNYDEFEMLKKAKEQYIVADASKFQRAYAWSVLPTNEIQNIVTEQFPSNSQEWQNNGIRIL